MKHWLVAIAVMLITVSSLAQDKDKPKDQGSRFVYADFEQLKDGLPVSTRGGTVLLMGYQQSPANAVTFTNSDKPWPQTPMVAKGAQNSSQFVAFDFMIPAPNQYAGVSLEIRGLPDKDGKQVGEDLSAYGFITVQVFAQGITTMKAELISKDNGVNIADGEQFGFPFHLTPGFNTYKLKLKDFHQDKWVENRKSLTDVLKHLTAVHFVAQEIPSKGRVVIDNVAFEK
ncbi:MAG: hypothetical protein ACJ74J_00165 [Blastocatellia bacterium]